MPASLIFDSKTIPVPLATRGFEDAEIRPPTVAVEKAVASLLRRPSEKHARSFATTLLAGCLRPRHTPSEIEALAETERARLRRALVEVCEEGSGWRALYGTHLNGDERLLALMVRRHERNREQVAHLVAKIGARHKQLSALPDAGSVGASAAVAEFGSKLKGMLTLTTEAQRTATVFNNILGPQMRGLGLFEAGRGGVQLGAAGAGLVGIVAQKRERQPWWIKPALGDGFRAHEASLSKSILGAVAGDASRISGVVGAGLRSHEAALSKSILGASAGEISFGKGILGAATGEAHWTNSILGSGLTRREESWSKGILGAFGLDAASASRALLPNIAPASGILDLITKKIGFSDGVMGFYEETHEFMEEWEADALWLLFQRMHIGAARPLLGLPKSEVEAIVLSALEMICSDGRFVPALRQAVSVAPYMTSIQREHLDHMLEHAEAGEYVRASAPLYPGLEGAYREAAYATEVMVRPASEKRSLGLVKVVKLMPVSEALKVLIGRGVFSGTGHAIRHGSSEGSERRQVLLGVIALAAWLERFASDAPALELLAEYLSDALPRAAQQVIEAPKDLGEPASQAQLPVPAVV
jgi:hypothetical protein